jgi:hypothetical protein
MDKFDQWWRSVYSDKPKHIHRQCYENGYEQGYDDGVAGVRMLRYVLFAVIALASVVMLAGCEDQYRYKCQNPDYFSAPECQKPKCLFTQMCPEYLVAPILKDQINAQNTQPSPEAAPNR